MAGRPLSGAGSLHQPPHCTRSVPFWPAVEWEKYCSTQLQYQALVPVVPQDVLGVRRAAVVVQNDLAVQKRLARIVQIGTAVTVPLAHDRVMRRVHAPW
eukprot:1469145-Rhodomonas_salina.3